jgi:hypothetical protein
VESIYKLDKFLTVDNMVRLVENNGLKIKSEIPTVLYETLEYYKRHLSNPQETLYILTKDQECKLRIDLGLDEYYTMEWNLKKLCYLIKREKLKKTTITPELLKRYIKEPKVHTPEDNNHPEFTEPIFLSYPPIKSKFLVIKGENIIHQHILNNVPIEGYYIPLHLHLQATTNPIYRSLLSIHFNYSLLCSYLAGQMKLEDVERRVLPLI